MSAAGRRQARIPGLQVFFRSGGPIGHGSGQADPGSVRQLHAQKLVVQGQGAAFKRGCLAPSKPNEPSIRFTGVTR